MATQVKFVSVPSKTLATSINASATAIQISDIKGWDGNNLAAANFGDVLWAVLRNSTNTQMEIMKLDPTTIAATSISILARGLDFSGGAAEVTANKLTWIKNDTIVELGSNPPQLLSQMMALSGNQTIIDLKTFSTLPQCTAVPTAASDLVNKLYVDGVVGGNANYDQNIVSGTAGENLTAGNVVYLKSSDGKWYVADSATASKSVGVQLGIVQATVLINVACRVLVGGRDKTQTTLTAGSVYYLGVAGAISTTKGANIRLVGQVPNGSTTDLVVNLASGDTEIQIVDGSRTYVADTGAANAYVMTLVPAITAYKAGQTFYFKATNANTTASTLNINGLGAKTIKKAGGATDLASGDIAAGQLVQVGYDGTNMVMLSPVANTPLSTASYKFGGTGADGALSISSGTTTLSIALAAYLEKNYTSISITGTGALAFSNPNATVGSVILLRSQAGVTITSNANPVIDLRSLGGTGGTGTSGSNNGTVNSSASGLGFLGARGRRVDGSAAINDVGSGGNGGASMINDGGNGGIWSGGFGTGRQQLQPLAVSWLFTPWSKQLFPGGGGEGGGGGNTNGFTGGNGGNGGRGAGSLDIECNGAYNFTTGTMNATGTAGSAGTAGTSNGGGGGGGGGGGCIRVVYVTLTADSGTYTVTGGAGGAGAGGGSTGGAGGDGLALRAVNNYWF